MGVSVIVPAYNEAKNIEAVLKGIRSAGKYEIIVVDDGSTDGTGRIAKKYARVITLKRNMGKGYACRKGAEAARHSALVFIDGDGQLPAGYIPPLLEKLAGCGLALGRRSSNNIPLQRRASNGFAGMLMKKITGSGIDCLCGLRAIRKGDFMKLGLKKDRYEFECEMTIKAASNSLRISSVPVRARYDDYRGMPFFQSMKVALYLLKEAVS